MWYASTINYFALLICRFLTSANASASSLRISLRVRSSNLRPDSAS